MNKITFSLAIFFTTILSAETIHSDLNPSGSCALQDTPSLSASWQNGLLEIVHSDNSVESLEFNHCHHMVEYAQECFYGNNKEATVWHRDFPAQDQCVEADLIKLESTACIYEIQTPFPCKAP